MNESLRMAALEYHRKGRPGKLSVTPTKQLSNQRDLALAYSPGVAAACEEIVADPANAFQYTSRGNLVAVISNGTAVLGLGNIGPLASKPVMEGKAVLFKRFSGIDVFDLEIDESDPDKLVDIIASLAPTFGGINLEDIKAPECFYVERKLRERLNIPVFHDDQHGTAITVAAAFLGGLKVVKKDIKKIKLVVSGAGAAALACLDLLVRIGLPIENIWVTDIEGVVYKGRTVLMDEIKAQYAQDTDKRTLAEVIEGADAFLGLSAGNVLKPEMLEKMTERPLILALANPIPEILPEVAKAARPDAVIATGRSDYPNQVNNVLCFPYIFRGALDVGATTITVGMEMAAVRAICQLAEEEQSEVVAAAYGTVSSFGPDYFLPKPFDPRLIVRIATAVAQAAMDDGVATRPIEDMNAYADQLRQFVYHSGTFMKPVYATAKRYVRDGGKSRIVYCEGEDERVLRAVQTVVDEKLARPILIGRPAVIQQRIERLGLRLNIAKDVEICDPNDDPRYATYWREYWELMKRKGVSKDYARVEMRRRLTLIGAMMVRMGDADGMLCGTVGKFISHLQFIDEVLGKTPDSNIYAAMNIVLLQERIICLADTHINPDPNASEIAEIVIKSAQALRRLDIEPKVALVSSSNYGTDTPVSGRVMREALAIVQEKDPSLEIDGEMHGDLALSEELREKFMPDSPLKGSANLLICPNSQAGNIAYNLLKTSSSGNVAVGPFLLGVNAPVHILTNSSTVRRIINMTAVTVVDANA
ncbi:NADP-dependent malic enzyme [Basilea psittacipulmonis]|uniref:Malate dehydrogenase n=1 Tax=Basilea psittacipulmonis DSM 24701 TaxID=1072685 RepID=A0A077DFT3_9BURK|nr:NADP-dependent malic enzyme [Basilea psittacipulmonis]AIL32217.1 malate dehydrogenase [Basilea psittacipulmonis DSM 24701]